MPFLHVTLGRKPSPAQQNHIAGALTAAIVRLLGKRHELTAVLVDGADGAWFIAGELLTGAQTPAHVDIFITAGSNKDEEKAAMIAATQATLAEQLGALPLASYVVIHEIAAGDWGYGGLTQAARRRTGSGL